jgi:flavin-binding protein dodecin
MRGRAATSFILEGGMPAARVTEMISSSRSGFEDAIEKGIARTAKALKNVEGA